MVRTGVAPSSSFSAPSSLGLDLLSQPISWTWPGARTPDPSANRRSFVCRTRSIVAAVARIASAAHSWRSFSISLSFLAGRRSPGSPVAGRSVPAPSAYGGRVGDRIALRCCGGIVLDDWRLALRRDVRPARVHPRASRDGGACMVGGTSPPCGLEAETSVTSHDSSPRRRASAPPRFVETREVTCSHLCRAAGRLRPLGSRQVGRAAPAAPAIPRSVVGSGRVAAGRSTSVARIPVKIRSGSLAARDRLAQRTQAGVAIAIVPFAALHLPPHFEHLVRSGSRAARLPPSPPCRRPPAATRSLMSERPLLLQPGCRRGAWSETPPAAPAPQFAHFVGADAAGEGVGQQRDRLVAHRAPSRRGSNSRISASAVPRWPAIWRTTVSMRFGSTALGQPFAHLIGERSHGQPLRAGLLHGTDERAGTPRRVTPRSAAQAKDRLAILRCDALCKRGFRPS